MSWTYLSKYWGAFMNSNNSTDQLIRSLDIIDGMKSSKSTRHELKDLTIEPY
jgi:hypothetical protein